MATVLAEFIKAVGHDFPIFQLGFVSAWQDSKRMRATKFHTPTTVIG
jgi:hypothetical protein